jgi:uncharacterized membrane protein YphA (DoxX/SURF4 family)
MKAALAVLRVLLGLVFIYASYDKLLHPAQFAEAVANYRLLPPAAVGIAAHTLPMLELACGLLLVLGVATAGASLVTSLLLLAFSAAVALAMWQGLDIACGCFSAAAERVGWPVLLRDLGLLAASLAVLVGSLRQPQRRIIID